MRDFGGESGQGSGVGLSGPVFVDDGAQLWVAVEGCAADLGLFGDGGEGDRVAEVASSVQTRSTLIRALSLMRAPIGR